MNPTTKERIEKVRKCNPELAEKLEKKFKAFDNKETVLKDENKRATSV